MMRLLDVDCAESEGGPWILCPQCRGAVPLASFAKVDATPMWRCRDCGHCFCPDTDDPPA